MWPDSLTHLKDERERTEETRGEKKCIPYVEETTVTWSVTWTVTAFCNRSPLLILPSSSSCTVNSFLSPLSPRFHFSLGRKDLWIKWMRRTGIQWTDVHDNVYLLCSCLSCSLGRRRREKRKAFSLRRMNELSREWGKKKMIMREEKMFFDEMFNETGSDRLTLCTARINELFMHWTTASSTQLISLRLSASEVKQMHLKQFPLNSSSSSPPLLALGMCPATNFVTQWDAYFKLRDFLLGCKMFICAGGCTGREAARQLSWWISLRAHHFTHWYSCSLISILLLLLVPLSFTFTLTLHCFTLSLHHNDHVLYLQAQFIRIKVAASFEWKTVVH